MTVSPLLFEPFRALAPSFEAAIATLGLVGFLAVIGVTCSVLCVLEVRYLTADQGPDALDDRVDE